MNFNGISLHIVDGEDGKYGLVVKLPPHLKAANILNKKRGNLAVDPLDFSESIGINLEEV